MRNAKELARIFKVLSVDTRVRIVQLIKHRSLCVNMLARLLGVTPAAVSQHLRVLRDARIVTAEKRGYFVHYRVNKTTLAAWNKATRAFMEMGKGGPANSSARGKLCPRTKRNKGG